MNDKLNNYRKKLNNDTVVLLIISIVSIIFGIISNSDEGTSLFIRSCIYFIFLVIMILNRKEMKKHVGSLVIVISSIMIVTSIFTRSLFDILFLMLGIFYMIHAIKYLATIKRVDQNKNEKGPYSYLKYISMLLIVVAVLLFIILGIFTDMSLVGFTVGGVIICSLNLASFIICIISHIKKERNVIVYLYMVISLLITILTGMFIIGDIRTEIRNKKRENSEDYIIKLALYAEEGISNSIVNNEVLKRIDINKNKENIVFLSDVKDLFEYEIYPLKELEKKGYICEGYTILLFNEKANVERYNELLNDNYKYEMNNYFSKNETYLKCNGKYSYISQGYNANKLK